MKVGDYSAGSVVRAQRAGLYSSVLTGPAR